MTENDKPMDVNVRVGLIHREKGPTPPKKRTGKKVLKVFLIVILVIVVGIAAAIGIAYAAMPNNVESFTQYLTGKEDGHPYEWTFTFSAYSGCMLRVKNVATGEINSFTRWSDGEQILYENKATGAMTFKGEEYTNRAQVKADGDKWRKEDNVSRKLIRLSKGRNRV